MIWLAFPAGQFNDGTMIAAAMQNSASGKLFFNWFDLALVLVIIFGFWRGRKHGMTKECLPFLQWVVMIGIGALGYQPLGDFLQQHGYIQAVLGRSMDSKTTAYVASYLTITLLLLGLFSMIKWKLRPNLEGSNFFGSSEYYLGMVCGVIRCLGILIFGLALLNAPYYSPAEIAAIKLYKLNAYAAGGHVQGMENNTGDFIPSTYEVQDSVFKQSLIGPFIKDKLSLLLVNTTGPGGPAAKPAVISIGN